jgi:hypothetical protein
MLLFGKKQLAIQSTAFNPTTHLSLGNLENARLLVMLVAHGFIGIKITTKE